MQLHGWFYSTLHISLLPYPPPPPIAILVAFTCCLFSLLFPIILVCVLLDHDRNEWIVELWIFWLSNAALCSSISYKNETSWRDSYARQPPYQNEPYHHNTRVEGGYIVGKRREVACHGSPATSTRKLANELRSFFNIHELHSMYLSLQFSPNTNTTRIKQVVLFDIIYSIHVHSN